MSGKQGRRLTRSELEGLAREATREALSPYLIPEEMRKQLVLGIGTDENFLYAELYVPGPRTEDAKYIAKTRVDVRTGKVEVEVLLEQKK